MEESTFIGKSGTPTDVTETRHTGLTLDYRNILCEF